MLTACNSQEFMQSIIIKLHENTDETKAACRPLFLLIVITTIYSQKHFCKTKKQK